ncbi:MAG: CCA tRNA nucleotidyltransferase [bacterium]
MADKKKDILKKIGKIGDQQNLSVYAVGGYVRDSLMNRETDEIDFVVTGDGPAFAEEVKHQLNGYGFSVFKNFGTASLHYKDIKLEFVSARRESYQPNSRNPEITLASLQDDLKRRDFTINALAMDVSDSSFGTIIDPFNGTKDIKQKIIRTPSDPEQTFYDDPLRILRAARFASQLQFTIDKKTLQAMKEERNRIRIISQERITDELMKMLLSDKPSIGFNILKNSGLLKIIFPELDLMSGTEQRGNHHHKDVFDHTLKVVDNLAQMTNDKKLLFTGLVHDVGKPRVKKFIKGKGWTFHGHDYIGMKMLKKICRKLRLSNKMYNYSSKLTRLHMRPIHLIDEEVTDSAIRRLLVDAGEDIEDLMTLCKADITSGNPKRVKKHLKNFDNVWKRIKEVEEKDKLRAFQSPVRGDTIMKVCKIKPGPKVGKLKKAIEDAILEGKIPNDHDQALEYLLKIKDDYLKKK